MPRGGGGRSRSPSRSRAGYDSPTRTRSYNSPPKPAPTPQHPSMMRQMAATAGGVAAGSLIAGALMGGSRESGESQNDNPVKEPEEDDPCAQELKNLIACFEMAQETGSDLKICANIEKKLIECRNKYGPRK